MERVSVGDVGGDVHGGSVNWVLGVGEEVLENYREDKAD